MSIDTKRLATDPDYWDEVAPEGSSAAYVHEHGVQFLKISGVDGDICYFAPNGYWVPFLGRRDGVDRWRRSIPRPQAQAAEWDGSDRPPIGVWVEHNKHGNFASTKIIGYDGILPICSHGDGKYYGVPMSCMRPIRTKEQREREEFITWATREIGISIDEPRLGKLFDAGLRKPEDAQ